MDCNSDGKRTRNYRLKVAGFLASGLSLFAISVWTVFCYFIHTEINETWSELDSRIYEFKIVSDDTWKELNLLSIPRHERQAGYGDAFAATSQCQCSPSAAEKCPPGPPGEKGPPGERGPDGPDGAPGADGMPTIWSAADSRPYNHSCFICPPGDSGRPGLPGQPGLLGLRGADSRPGLQGLDGQTGPPGERGLPGPPGKDGRPGAKGCKGNDIKGMTAAKGSKGLPGPVGERGDKGPPGQDGITGEMGPIGPGGPQGLPGKEGPRGPPGPPGLKAGRTGPDAVYCLCPAKTRRGPYPTITDENNNRETRSPTTVEPGDQVRLQGPSAPVQSYSGGQLPSFQSYSSGQSNSPIQRDKIPPSSSFPSNQAASASTYSTKQEPKTAGSLTAAKSHNIFQRQFGGYMKT